MSSCTGPTSSKRLTPRNKDALLFDDVLWVKRARQEHDAFADALADRGVEVLYLEELLAEVLESPAVRDQVIARTLDGGRPRPDLGPRWRPGSRRAARARRPPDRRHHL